MPWYCTSTRCRASSAVVMAGRIATCTPKNRVSVAPVTSLPPRMKWTIESPMPGTTPAMLVPTRVAKNASSFHGSR